MAAKVQIIFYLQSVKYLFFVKNKLFFREKMTIFAEKLTNRFSGDFSRFTYFVVLFRAKVTYLCSRNL